MKALVVAGGGTAIHVLPPSFRDAPLAQIDEVNLSRWAQVRNPITPNRGYGFWARAKPRAPE